MHCLDPVDNAEQASFPDLLHFVLSLVLQSNHHPILASSDPSQDFLEEEGDVLQDEPDVRDSDLLDDVTGDFIEIPASVIEDSSETGRVLHRSLLLLSKLLLFPSVYCRCAGSVWELCHGSLQAAAREIGSGELPPLVIKDYCTVLRLLSCVDFRERNLEALVLLSQIIQ